MSNKRGQAYALTVLTPILPGHEEELVAYLDALPQEPSPLAKVEGTHFARWVVIGQLVHEGPTQKKQDRLKSQYLLFTTNFDGPLDLYIERLRTSMADEARTIWGHCVGAPDPSEAKAFARYLRHNRIDTGFFYCAYPHARVVDVRESLALRDRIIDLAVASEGMPADELKRLFLERFPDAPPPLNA